MARSPGKGQSPQSQAPKVKSRRVGWLVGLIALATAGTLAAVVVRSLDFDKWQGLELAGHGKFAEAEPYLQLALARHPQDVEVIQALALGNLGVGRTAEAEPFLSRWCELRPREAEPFKRRMDWHVSQRDFPKALADGQHVLELEPDNAEVGHKVAPMLLIIGRPEEAESECRHWLERDPDNPTLLYLFADICHQRGNNVEAERNLDRLLRFKPDAPNALLLRGILYDEADQPEKAMPLLRRVLALKPPMWQQLAASYHLSLALSHTGESEAAQRVLADVQWHLAADLMGRKEQPKVPGLLLRVAEAKIGIGQTSEAADLLGRILAQDPNCVPEAVRLLEKVVAKEQRCLTAHRLLSDYYDKQGDPVRAAEHRRRAKP